VFAVTERNFSVEVIPHTLRSTTLGFKEVGDAVNIENDMLVKYVERILVARETARAAS
jgi:riboflavin synthase